MVIARKIAYNVVVSSISKVFSTVLALVSIGIITRYLGASGFGEYATVLAFLSFFSAIADLGLNQTVTREISRPGAKESDIMGRIFPLRVTASLVMVIIAPAIALFFPYPTEVKQAIVIVALSFVFSSSYQILNGVFQKNLAMDKVAISEFLGKLLQVIVIIIAVKLGAGFNWIIASLLFNMAFCFMLIFSLSKKYIHFKIKIDVKYWKNFLRTSYPLGLAAIINIIYFKIDTILLSVMKPSADVGIYNAAYKVIENITFFPAMIIGLVLPIMSHSIFSDKARFKDICDKTFKVFCILVVPLVVGALFLSKDIINLIGGAGFVQSSGVLQILIFALAAIFFSNFSNAILIAGNLQKKLMLVALSAAIVNVTANLILIPRYSYWAAASVSTATEVLVAILAWLVVMRSLKYNPKIEKLFTILLSGAAMATYLWIGRSLNFFLLAVSSALVYFFFLWILRAIKTEEITSIIGRK